jgi:ectoine hydroxylase-related dioxygenase (phytanoyl-CoA dioxygenase family)
MGAHTADIDLTGLAAGFQRDGACVVRGLLDAQELARLEQGVERNLAAPSERAIEGGGDAGAGRFFEDFRNWTRIREYEQVIRESRLGEVAARLMGSRTVRLHHDHLLVKEPGTTIRTPWHQDQPFYNIDGFQTVSFWIPLDPVPRESTLEFVAGSHASRTWYMPRSFFDDRPLVFDEGTFAEVPDVEADRDAYTILGWALEPGDAVAFNMLTLHAAAGSRNRRRAFSVRLVGDDVRLAARPHPTSPTFPELDGVLGDGDALEHAVFPLLSPREGVRTAVVGPS